MPNSQLRRPKLLLKVLTKNLVQLQAPQQINLHQAHQTQLRQGQAEVVAVMFEATQPKKVRALAVTTDLANLTDSRYLALRAPGFQAPVLSSAHATKSG